MSSSKSKSISAISTSRLAKALGLEAKAVFAILQQAACIERDGDKWRLTEKGEGLGGAYQQSDKYGEFVTWPEALQNHEMFADTLPEWLSATRLGQVFDVSAKTANALLADLGLLNKDQRGWMLSSQAEKLGAEQRNSKQGFYVVWPASIIDNEWIKASFDSVAASRLLPALDGRECANKAELKIVNWLYLQQICFAYQKPIAFSDKTVAFFLPERQIYMDYWGIDNLSLSLSQKLEREDWFKSQGLRYIEIDDDQLKDLENVLPKKLLQFGMQL